jgi:hypothetical protein
MPKELFYNVVVPSPFIYQHGANMRKDSALIRLDELDAERSSLVEEAKADTLDTIQEAIEQLESLGFSYQLVETAAVNGTPSERTLKAKAKVSSKRTTSPTGTPKRGRKKGLRRAGIRQDVLQAIAKSGKNGMTRGELITHFRASDDSFRQSISNALAALKKQKSVKASKGVYKAA